MPDTNARTMAELRLYSRCKASGKLPFAGGVLEQPEWVLRLFDDIEEAQADWKREKDEADEMERWKKDALGRLTGGR